MNQGVKHCLEPMFFSINYIPPCLGIKHLMSNNTLELLISEARTKPHLFFAWFLKLIFYHCHTTETKERQARSPQRQKTEFYLLLFLEVREDLYIFFVLSRIKCLKCEICRRSCIPQLCAVPCWLQLAVPVFSILTMEQLKF